MAVVITHGAAAQSASGPAQYDAMIARHAAANGVPETLVRRVIVRESRYNPKAYNRGHYGMMQIKHATAKGMGYQGDAAGLLDADTNLTYAVRYLAGAYRTAGGNHDRAVQLYASGYYYEAKRKGLLDQVGMGRRGSAVFAQAIEMAPHARAKAPAQVVANAAKPATVVTTTVATAEPRQPRVIAVNAAPALASAAPLPPTRPATTIAVAAAPQIAAQPATPGVMPSTVAGSRIAAASDAIGGFDRTAPGAAPATPVATASAYSNGRDDATAAFAKLTPPANAAAVPLPPIAPRATAAAAAKPGATVAAKPAPVDAPKTVAMAAAPLPPVREPAVETTAAISQPAAKLAPPRDRRPFARK